MRQVFSCNRRHGGKSGLGILVFLLLSPAACGAALQVAVASNFRSTLEQLAPGFNREQAEDIKISSGSSGMLYAQIVHGAPFDVFLSADSSYPRRLEQDGLALHRRTYARGILVLVYQPELAELAQTGAAAILRRPGLSLAIANPRLAPYGIAAQQVLERLGSKPSPLLRGANISQAYQMWRGGGADAALVARSQVLARILHQPSAAAAESLAVAGRTLSSRFDIVSAMPSAPFRPCAPPQRRCNALATNAGAMCPEGAICGLAPWLDLPREWYGDMQQQAVLLRRTPNPVVAKDFLQWLLSPAIQAAITGAGFDPGVNTGE